MKSSVNVKRDEMWAPEWRDSEAFARSLGDGEFESPGAQIKQNVPVFSGKGVWLTLFLPTVMYSQSRASVSSCNAEGSR